jgi:cyclophilin family peptidyl-prolyl cis-trans isomerase
MRVVALIAVIAVLVAGGFWLARERGTPTGPATETMPAAVTGSEAPSEAADPDTAAVTGLAADASADLDSEPGPDANAAQEPNSEPDAAGEGEEPAPEEEQAEEATPADADEGSVAATDDSAAVAGGTVDLASLLPVGYTPVAFLSDEPKRLFEGAEQVLEADTDYVALLHTNRGDIVIDLYEDRTPITVNNFLFLALNRYYQGVPFHRVLEDFMAQTGDPTGTGSGGPGYQFQDEIVDGLAFDSVGQVAMANAGAGTNGSQFFITFAATPWLTGAHTIFGEVLSGVELLDMITRVDPSSPSAIVLLTDTVADLAAKGIDLPADADMTVEAALESILGTSPVSGQSFTAAGYRGVMGQMGADPAYGFFPQPDTILDVVVGARPTS